MGKAAVTNDQIVHAIDGLQAIENTTRLARLEQIVEYDKREAWKEDGACSMVDWVCFRRGCARTTAAEELRIGHALHGLPAIRAAYAEGRLSDDKVALITQVADSESDALWAQEAEQLSYAQLESWVREHRSMRREDAERKMRERCLRMRLVDDTLRINGRLHGAEAVAVKQAIETIAADAPKLEDGTYAPWDWRCADALVELASCSLGELDRATVVVHTDAKQLNAIHGKGAVEDGPSIVAETARRLACDGKVQLSVDDESGKPLKLGRTKRTVPPWLGRWIRARDKGCCFAGCGRTRGLQVHHIHHWAHGGRTDDDNLVSLCWYHHRLVHEGGWKIRKDAESQLRFIRPDGRPLSKPTRLDPSIRLRLFGPRRE